jgi:hypothetical protein
MLTESPWEGNSLRGASVHVTALCATRVLGEEQNELPIITDVRDVLAPKLLPVIVTNPPNVGLNLDTTDTDGESAVNN